MNLRIILISITLLTPLPSCADSHSANDKVATTNNRVLENGDVLSISDSLHSASLFSTQAANRGQLAKNIIDILGAVSASESIISFAEKRVHKNRRLKRANFKLPLTDKNGDIYQFTYSSDISAKIFILNYQFIKASDS